MAMTAIPGASSSGNPGGGVGADLGGSYHRRDGGVRAAADRTGNGGGSGAGAHGGWRDNGGTEPDTVIPPPSIDNSMRGGGGGGGDRGEAGAWAATDPESFLRENLSLKDLVSLAYMFNFVEAGVLGLGERKAVVQVREGGRERGRARALFRGHLRKDTGC